MELRHLRYFVAAAETGSMSQGAQKLNVVQSALSHLIAKLEIEIGHQLFDRHGRRIALSPVGEIFLEDARAILNAADAALDRARRAGDGRLGKLQVGCQAVACCRAQVSESLRLFRARYPDVELGIRMGLAVSLLAQVRAGEIDAAFVYLVDDQDDLDVRPLFVDDWLLALPIGHPLLDLPELRLKDLADASFIWIPRDASPVIYDRMLSEAHRGGLSPNIVQEAFDESMMLNLVATGMGVSFLAQSAVTGAPEGVRFRSVSDFGLQQRFCLVSRARPETQSLQRMRDLVGDVFADAGVSRAR